ncbi:hypothetical protein PDE_07760 [Penicillium oxalicum 114-2]|uniref:Uncharacterized protein n=1 Tax=Penicillium oxalicum (strain 114-2 / CGMCC 5302) TaxID=933388 RepID=S7ZQ10_PENO1|nr:hypothetical protein PDE_07760 [Penicillium oxalicum 114-2]
MNETLPANPLRASRTARPDEDDDGERQSSKQRRDPPTENKVLVSHPRDRHHLDVVCPGSDTVARAHNLVPLRSSLVPRWRGQPTCSTRSDQTCCGTSILTATSGSRSVTEDHAKLAPPARGATHKIGLRPKVPKLWAIANQNILQGWSQTRRSELASGHGDLSFE